MVCGANGILESRCAKTIAPPRRQAGGALCCACCRWHGWSTRRWRISWAPTLAEALIRATALDAAGALPGAGDHPLRVITATPQLARSAHAGVVCVFTACCTRWSYSWFDMAFDIPDILHDIAKRPFPSRGHIGLRCCWPCWLRLSFNRAIGRLGGKRWQALHRTVYAVAGLAVLHFFWMRAGKNNFGEGHLAAILGGAAGLAALATDCAGQLHGTAQRDVDCSMTIY